MDESREKLVSVITTILSTDIIGNSRGVINSNFTNLNTDKLETVTEANITLIDVTTNNFGITKHGFVPKGTNVGNFLRDDGTWVLIPGGGNALTASPLSQFAATTSAQLAGVISNETGTGLLVFNSSPTLITPVLGVATATSINGLRLTASAGTLTIPNSASAFLITSGNFSITLTATAATNVTLPTAGTLGTLAGVETLTNKRITKRVLALSANSATPAINTDNFDVVHITAQTAAITSLTTNLTGAPVDGDTLRISVTGTGAVGITWGASFASSTVTLPITTVGTARLDVGFFYNTETSLWRCVAVS